MNIPLHMKGHTVLPLMHITINNIGITIEDEGYAEGYWISYTFTIDHVDYFMAKTPYDPYWEIMEDFQDEEDDVAFGAFVPVAVGTNSCKAWLADHGLLGLIA